MRALLLASIFVLSCSHTRDELTAAEEIKAQARRIFIGQLPVSLR